MAHEWRDTDDRVMPPVMGFAGLPEVQAGGEQRPVDAGRELLHAGIESVASRGTWRGLDDACVGIRFDQPNQRGQAFAAHHAVRVQHDHVAIILTPAPAEIGDVAALAFDPVLAPSIKNAAEATDRAAHVKPGGDFSNADIGLVRIGEHEEIEVLELARALQRIVARAQSGEDSPPGTDEARCAALAVRREAADHRNQRQRMPRDHRRATIELRATGGLVTRRSRPTASLTSLGAGVSVGGYANSRRRWI